VLSVGADLARAFVAASVTEASARVYLDARAQGVEVPELRPADVEAIAQGWREQWQARVPA
jgi:ribulose-5-phosphate 4-epimerase/fuculose-1-phosphate aldolase